MRKIVKLECEFGHRGFYSVESFKGCASVRYYFLENNCNKSCVNWDTFNCSVFDAMVIKGSQYLLLNENEN